MTIGPSCGTSKTWASLSVVGSQSERKRRTAVWPASRLAPAEPSSTRQGRGRARAASKLRAKTTQGRKRLLTAWLKSTSSTARMAPSVWKLPNPAGLLRLSASSGGGGDGGVDGAGADGGAGGGGEIGSSNGSCSGSDAATARARSDSSPQGLSSSCRSPPDRGSAMAREGGGGVRSALERGSVGRTGSARAERMGRAPAVAEGSTTTSVESGLIGIAGCMRTWVGGWS